MDLSPDSRHPPLRSPGTPLAGAPAESALARSRGTWIGLLLLALAARMAFVFILPDRLMWEDPKEYFRMGRELAEQGTYGLQTLRPPGYPTFIAGVFRIFGPHLVPLRIVEALLATVAVGLIGWIARQRFGPTVGWIATALAALHPLLAFMPATTYPESLSVLLFVLSLLTAFEGVERRGVGWWAATGVLMGLQILVRPNAIALVPGFGFGCLILLVRGGRGWLVPAVVAAIACAATLAPWIVRNHTVNHHWYFISTGGGRQLWAGNNPYATGLTNQGTYTDPHTDAMVLSFGDPVLADRYYTSESFRFMREHPGRAFQLYLRKLGNIFALVPDTLSRTYVNPASRIAQGGATVVIYLGVLLGLARIRSAAFLWPPLLGTATFVLATALAFSSFRYRVPVEPALILAAAVGFAPWLARLVPDRSGESRA